MNPFYEDTCPLRCPQWHAQWALLQKYIGPTFLQPVIVVINAYLLQISWGNNSGTMIRTSP